MKSMIFSQRQGIILLISIVIVAIVAVLLYGAFRVPPSPDGDTPLSATTPLSSNTVVSSSTTSPVSPLSLVSPVSPLSQTPLNPPMMESMVQQGIALYNNQDYAGAMKIFNDILAQDSRNFLAYNARGTTFLELKEYDRAIADYSKAVELQPLFADAYYNLGRTYRLLEKYNEAVTNLKKSIEISPAEFGYRANGNIGLIYHQQGKYDQALEALAEAISYDDAKADTYYFRGETYTATGDYETAINDYQAAVSRFPRYDLAYQGLAYAYYKTGQYEQSLQALQQAADISPNSATIHFYRMLVYLATHRIDEAKAEVSQGMEAIGALSEEEQSRLFTRVLADLDTFAQENPDQAENVKVLTNLIPPPG